MAWSTQEQQNIQNFYNQYKDDPATIARGMKEIGLSTEDFAQYTGQSVQQANQYLGNVAPANNYASVGQYNPSTGYQAPAAAGGYSSTNYTPTQPLDYSGDNYAKPGGPKQWSAQEQQNIQNFYNQYKDDPATMLRGMGEIGLSMGDFARFTGQTEQQAQQYLGVAPGPNVNNAPFYVSAPGAALGQSLSAPGLPTNTAPAGPAKQGWEAAVLRSEGAPYELAQAMRQYGVTPQQAGALLGWSEQTVNQRLNTAWVDTNADLSGIPGLQPRKTMQQYQAEMDAFGRANGIQVPNLSDPAFRHLLISDDPVGNFVRQGVGARTIGGGHAYDLGPQTPSAGGGQGPRDMRSGGITQQQINENNFWGTQANRYLGGNPAWWEGVPGYTPPASYSAPPPAAPNRAPAPAGPSAPPPPGNGYDPRDMRYQPYPGGSGAAGKSGNLGFGGGGGYQSNPFLAANAQEMIRQVNNNLNETIMPGIRSGAQAAGQYGSSRQGIAEGIAAGRSVDGLAAALASMYGGAYNADLQNNTALQGLSNQFALGLGQLGLGNKTADNSYALGLGQLGLGNKNSDQSFALGLGQLGLGNKTADNSYALGLGQLGLGAGQLGLSNRVADQNFALGAGQLGLSANTANQNFYTSQRGQDLQQYQLGAGMFNGGVQGNLGIGQGMYGLGQQYMNAPMGALGMYSNIISPYSGMNSTPANFAGAPSPWMAGVGGALGGYQLYQNFTRPGAGGATNNLVGTGQQQGWF